MSALVLSPLCFVAAYVLDLVMGDPQWLPHPVRLIGRAIEAGETILRTRSRGKASEFLKGMVLTLIVAGASGGFSAWLIRAVIGCHPGVGSVLIIGLAATTMATRNLINEARRVGQLLRAGELEGARVQVGRIVGRDTQQLDEPEVVRATVETLAESASDGIVAPIFFLALGGVPAAMTYKAINTLDSMIGHNDDTYRYFGKFAARLDDVANYLPARLTALLIAIAAFLCGKDGLGALRVWLRDGSKHASPNAGQPEAAMAGALGVRLGGLNYYDGIPHEGPFFGNARRSLGNDVIAAALRIIVVVSILSFLLALGWLSWWHGYAYR